TGLTPSGSRQLEQIGPSARVLYVQHPGLSYGVILGVEPDFMVDGRRSLSDYVSLQSRCGPQVDGVQQAPFRLAQNGDVIDWSAGRPNDALSGDAGRMAETGVGYFADADMAY